jgi:hypothetical protein
MSSAQEQVEIPDKDEAPPPDAEAEGEAAEGAAPDDDAESDASSSDVPEGTPEPKWWEEFRDFYLTFDRRTLGLTRLLLGFFLIFDLLRRTDDWWKMFSNEGVLPSHFNLFRPQSNGWSLFNAFATRGELWALWAFGMAVFVCLFIGYKTKVMQIIAALYVASMNGRVLLIENGGYVVHNLLLLWTAFLPLGDRFSVDALLASMKTQRERSVADLNNRETDTAKWRVKQHVTFVAFILLIQVAAIYAFNVMHKTGPAWHDGTAVHYVLWVDRMVNPFIAWVRPHIPPFVIIILTKSVMGMEAGLPLALLSPLARVWAKRVAILFMNLLHIGFATTFVLGPFAWALCVFSSLLLSKEDWELAIRTMRRTGRARTVRFDPRDEALFFWCRILKRLDKFQLLKFKGDKTVTGFVTVAPDGTEKQGWRALYDMLDALPGGTCIAWLAPVAMGKAWLIGRIAGFGRRKAKKLPAQGYRPELKDDAAGPTVDAPFMASWLGRHDRAHNWRAGRMLLALPAGATAGLAVFGIIEALLQGAQAVLVNTEVQFARGLVDRTLVSLGNIGPKLILGAAPLAALVAVGLDTFGARNENDEDAGYRVPTWLMGLVTLVGGLFLYVYGTPMMRRFQWDTFAPVFGGDGTQWAAFAAWFNKTMPTFAAFLKKWELGLEPAMNRDRSVNWLGASLALWGSWAFFKPFIVMNVTTPSTPARKWLRVQAGFREAFATVMMCGAINQAMVELWVARPLNAPQPEAARVLSHKMRYLQGWFMFSPNPVMDDGTIVTDCVTVDGRRIDPFSTDAFRVKTPLPPDMDLLHSRSFAYNQIWSDYYNRMHLPQNTAFRESMKSYIFRLPERTGNPNDICVKGAVYWVHDMNPRFRRIDSYAYNRDELFRFTNPDLEVQRRYEEWLQAHGGQDPPEAPLPVPLPKPANETPRN